MGLCTKFISLNHSFEKKFNSEQRVFLLQIWLKENRKSQQVIAAFSDKFPRVNPPTRQAVHNISAKFENSKCCFLTTKWQAQIGQVIYKIQLEVLFMAVRSHWKSFSRTEMSRSSLYLLIMLRTLEIEPCRSNMLLTWNYTSCACLFPTLIARLRRRFYGRRKLRSKQLEE